MSTHDPVQLTCKGCGAAIHMNHHKGCEFLTGRTHMIKPKYDTIQPNGVCWDCGGQAIPISNSSETQTTIGWQCGCGRFWPALGDDVDNWIRAASSEILHKKYTPRMVPYKFTGDRIEYDTEAEIDRGQGTEA